MQVKLHHPEDLTRLRQESHQQRDAKQRDRYRAILLALEGHHAPVIAKTLARSRRFVQRWVYTYRDHGLAAVAPERQTGRPPNLPATEEASFKERFLADPTEADGVCTLRGKEARQNGPTSQQVACGTYLASRCSGDHDLESLAQG
mgnify:CR=1 FL=1